MALFRPLLHPFTSTPPLHPPTHRSYSSDIFPCFHLPSPLALPTRSHRATPLSVTSKAPALATACFRLGEESQPMKRVFFKNFYTYFFLKEYAGWGKQVVLYAVSPKIQFLHSLVCRVCVCGSAGWVCMCVWWWSCILFEDTFISVCPETTTVTTPMMIISWCELF